jgi:acyl-CoA thioesterase
MTEARKAAMRGLQKSNLQMKMHTFDRDISFAEKGPLVFEGRVSENWSINGTPNGGYLMALLAHAMSKHSDKQKTPILTANYISRCTAGEATIRLEKISQSNRFSRLQARLFQGGKETTRMLGTFAEEQEVCNIKRYERPAPELTPVEGCISIPAMSGYTLFDHLDVRLDPGCAGWMQNRLGERSEHRGWVRFRDDRPFDLLAVLLVADAFPPPAFVSQGATSWVPTLEFSVNVRNIPETRWLKCTFRTCFINCGLLEEDGEIWDEKGELIAISRQIAQFRKTPESKV